MQCEELEIRIHELLDRRELPGDDPAVAAHAAVCTECGELVAACKAMLDGVEALPMPDPSEQFVASVLDRAADSAAVRRRSSGHLLSIAASLAVAASLLIAFAFWWQRQEPNPAGPSDIATSNDRQPEPTAIVKLFPEQLQSEQIHGLCLTTGHNIATLPQTVRRVASSPDGSGLAGRIRPVTRPMGFAIGILKRTLPAGTEKTSDADHDTGWIAIPGGLAFC